MQMDSPKQQPAQPVGGKLPSSLPGSASRETRRSGGGGWGWGGRRESIKHATPAEEERKIQKQRRIHVTSMAESRTAAEAFNNLLLLPSVNRKCPEKNKQRKLVCVFFFLLFYFPIDTEGD